MPALMDVPPGWNPPGTQAARANVLGQGNLQLGRGQLGEMMRSNRSNERLGTKRLAFEKWLAGQQLSAQERSDLMGLIGSLAGGTIGAAGTLGAAAIIK